MVLEKTLESLLDSKVPFSMPGDLPDLGIESGSPALQVDSLLAKLPGKLIYSIGLVINSYNRLE